MRTIRRQIANFVAERRKQVINKKETYHCVAIETAKKKLLVTKPQGLNHVTAKNKFSTSSIKSR